MKTLKPNSFSAEQSMTAQWPLVVALLHLNFNEKYFLLAHAISKSKCEFKNVHKNSNSCEAQTAANLKFCVIDDFKTAVDYLGSQKSLSKS